VKSFGLFARRGLFMRGSGVLEDAYDFTLWQNVTIVQGKEQRFDNREGGVPSCLRGSGHQVSTFARFHATIRHLLGIVAGKCRVGLMWISVVPAILQNMGKKWARVALSRKAWP
jgi:hypothetical protein